MKLANRGHWSVIALSVVCEDVRAVVKALARRRRRTAILRGDRDRGRH